MDAHNIKKKTDAGLSTQYLLLVSDEDRALLIIDQVLALYLIDVADRCKKSPPLVNYSANDKDVTETTTAVSNSGKPQNTGRGSAQKGATSLASNNDPSQNLERNNYHFYMAVCVFIQLYRSCLNDSIYQTFEGRTSLVAATED